MMHQLVKTSDGYVCEVCHWQWRGKPRGKCPGCHRYADRYSIAYQLRAEIRTPLDFRRKNLKPISQPIACIQLTNPTRWEYFWTDAAETEVDIPDLPPIIKGSVPTTWIRASELKRYNRVVGDAQPKGSVWDLMRDDWEFLYELRECAIADPSLPPIYDWHAIPSGLAPEKEILKRGLDPISAKPKAATYLPGRSELTFYYDPTECKIASKAPDRYITKGTLKGKYLLSEGWIKRLGKPDFTTENPHYRNAAPMQLYLRSRVENFLAEHAEEYCTWLDRRDALIELAKANFAKSRATLDARKQQTKLCLQCASGVATSEGFVCGIYPTGWPLGVPEENLCPDWKKREYR